MKKCHFSRESVKYLDHVLSEERFRVDPDRVRNIETLENPRDKKALQRFLGAVNYVGQFIENLSDKTKCLRDLLKDDTEFFWLDENQKRFAELKNAW